MITHSLATTGHDSGCSHLHQICCCFISSCHTSRHISLTHKLQPSQGLLRAAPAPPKQGGALHPTLTHELFHKRNRFYGRFRHEVDMHREKKSFSSRLATVFPVPCMQQENFLLSLQSKNTGPQTPLLTSVICFF